MQNKGQFVISLDFEMYWGVRDIYSLSDYRERMASERELIPGLLKLFEENCIHTTWAVVGLMFFKNHGDLLNGFPELKPTYKNKKLSPYPYIAGGNVGEDESNDSDHYASSLIEEIRRTKYQRISTHTFSHYYCLEEWQTLEQFRDDLRAALRIAETQTIKIESIVFPRNQLNEHYIKVLKDLGIHSYRGNPKHWIYKKGVSDQDSLLKRGLRLMDTYFNLTGHNCFSLDDISNRYPVNIPASHFLRPYSKRLRLLEPLRLHRILSGMTHAAKQGLIYHLWWHPYNLASDFELNMNVLKKIINHYKKLQFQYGMTSVNMEEIAAKVMQPRYEKNA